MRRTIFQLKSFYCTLSRGSVGSLTSMRACYGFFVGYVCRFDQVIRSGLNTNKFSLPDGNQYATKITMYMFTNKETFCKFSAFYYISHKPYFLQSSCQVINLIAILVRRIYLSFCRSILFEKNNFGTRTFHFYLQLFKRKKTFLLTPTCMKFFVFILFYFFVWFIFLSCGMYEIFACEANAALLFDRVRVWQPTLSVCCVSFCCDVITPPSERRKQFAFARSLFPTLC